MKRAHIEVGKASAAPAGDRDPVSLFAYMLRENYGGDEEVEQYNRKLLNNLLSKNQISKNSVVWSKDKIVKIYGFRIDELTKRIEYDSSGSSSPERKQKTYVNNAPKLDMHELRNAILRSKQTAV